MHFEYFWNTIGRSTTPILTAAAAGAAGGSAERIGPIARTNAMSAADAGTKIFKYRMTISF
jgi:hypothetical protein